MLRISIYLIITLISGLLFLFVPALNFGGNTSLSIWDEMQRSGVYLDGTLKILFKMLFVLLGLFFIFGIKSKNQKNPR